MLSLEKYTLMQTFDKGRDIDRSFKDVTCHAPMLMWKSHTFCLSTFGFMCVGVT